MALRSPDGRTELAFALGDWRAEGRLTPGAPLWHVSFAGRVMLRQSLLMLALRDAPALCGGFGVAGVVRRRTPPGAAARELVVRLRESAAPSRRMDLVFRCYDGAVAVRLRLPRQPGLSRVPLPAVGAACRLPAGTHGWLESDGVFRAVPLDEAPRPLWRPLTLNYTHGKLACLFECADAHSHVSGYMRMVPTPWESPWLVLLLADRPCDLPERSAALLTQLGPRDAQPAAVASSDDAVRNCTLPFVNPPLWRFEVGNPAVRRPALRATATPAHRAAAALVLDAGEAAWDETRFLRGEIGAYVAVARRRGQSWQVGAITGAAERVLTVRLEDFLGASSAPAPYALEILRDPLPGEEAAGGLVCERFEGVESHDAPRLDLPAGGGFVLRLEPAGTRQP